jgi:hypothetical protein
MDYELDRLKEILECKIKKTSNDIHHELHNKAYNDSLQKEIHTLEWVLEYIGKNAQTNNNNNLEFIIQNKITDLTIREVTDFLFAEIETLRWVLYVIHSIEKGSLIV